jgi:hypothetical protein
MMVTVAPSLSSLPEWWSDIATIGNGHQHDLNIRWLEVGISDGTATVR